MMKEALEFEPDLIIIHTGHNEFFGAYGVNSISRGGTSVALLKLTRFVHSLALVQAIDQLLRPNREIEHKSLMEIMVGESYTAPEDPIRTTAAHNLEANLTEMLTRCKDRGVPAMVCTLPSNQRDLYPIGRDKTDALSPTQQTDFQTLLDQGTSAIPSNPSNAAVLLKQAVDLQPEHARAHFLLGKALYAQGLTNEAREAFIAARDLDSMPWRTTTPSQNAIRQAAATVGMPLCDMDAVFRTHSPGGCVGWELMSDHVHPTLHGQALMAGSIVATLHDMEGPPAVSDTELARIRSWEEYAAELGDNPYDRYGVDVAMQKLFSVPFVRERNFDGLRRYSDRVTRFESTLSPEMLAVMREWKSVRPHAGGKRPITGMVARQLMREQRYEEALDLYQIAQKAVPEYTSWYLEYVYFGLACREKLAGTLSDDERAQALSAIGQGKFLLQHGYSRTGLTERYVGRLYQLRGGWNEAIPFLNASREKLGGFELVAADQALFMSLLKTGRREEARQLAAYGVANSGQYAQFYQQMLQILRERDASMENVDP
jgi:tetratricopeptide (TPR) repeat protein